MPVRVDGREPEGQPGGGGEKGGRGFLEHCVLIIEVQSWYSRVEVVRCVDCHNRQQQRQQQRPRQHRHLCRRRRHLGVWVVCSLLVSSFEVFLSSLRESTHPTCKQQRRGVFRELKKDDFPLKKKKVGFSRFGSSFFPPSQELLLRKVLHYGSLHPSSFLPPFSSFLLLTILPSFFFHKGKKNCPHSVCSALNHAEELFVLPAIAI